jgi:prepilin-type processing-associated H-X9-DG protein
LAPEGRQNPAGGFSFPDLLALLSVAALLALIQFPARANNKSNSHRAVCADNQRRLALSWLMYADDNRGRLVPNRSDAFPATNNWVAGWLDFSGRTDNTNLATITQAKLYPYNQSVEIYRCPDDLTALRDAQNGYHLRVRSFSMNSWLGEGAGGWVGSPTDAFQIQTNRAQIRQPDQTFVFIEEHADSINDGDFVIDMSTSASLIDYPASYHYWGANLGFADGSVQFHQWINVPVIIAPLFPRVIGADVSWLQSRTTYRK